MSREKRKNQKNHRIISLKKKNQREKRVKRNKRRDVKERETKGSKRRKNQFPKKKEMLPKIQKKSRKKCEAFMNIVPKRKMDSINESELQRKNVQEYFDGFNERTIEISDVKPQRQKYGETKLSKLDLIF